MQYGPGLGDVIAAGASDGRIHFICAQTGEKLLSPRGEKAIRCVAFSPDGSLIAAGDGGLYGSSGEVRIYNASTGDPVGSPLNVGCAPFFLDFVLD